MRTFFILLAAFFIKFYPQLFSFFKQESQQPGIQILSWDEAYAKAAKLVSKMTLEQKVNITTGVGWMGGRCIGNTGSALPYFPELCLQDSPLGVRLVDGVSSGVAGINAAASFDKQAIRRRGEYIGEESRALGIHALLGPGVNMMRAPAAGRNWEAFGEDPYLVGVATANTIEGIQGQGVMAVVKHLIGNEQETNRLIHSVHIDEKAMHEVYLWPFARAVEAGVASVMCSYNKIDGIYACENDYVNNQLLKGSLHFKGFIQSDWGATHSTVNSVVGGLDMTMPGDIDFGSGDSYFGVNLTNAVREGRVSNDRVTDMATRIVAAWYKLGQDTGFPEVRFDSFKPERAQNEDVQGNHKMDIRHMGAASTVLLKNIENILPLDESHIKKLAIIGSDAGPNSKELNCELHACHDGTLAQGWGSGTANYPYLITPLDGIKKRSNKKFIILEHLEDNDLASATKLASEADIAIVFSSANSGEEFITVEGHKGDRNHLQLWSNGDNLIKAVADANPNTIVVIHSVGPVLMPWVDHPNIKAIVWPGLPGQESGNALADVLYGDVNPSARLPYTIARYEKDYPASIDTALNITYHEGVNIGYRWFDKNNIEPLYEFGYGLSYTQFEYHSGKVSIVNKYSQDPNVQVVAFISIRNVGSRAGAEIPQLYLTFPDIAKEPPKLLRGFEKVFLNRKEEKTITFNLTKTELSYYAEDSQEWVVPEGTFNLHIGSSSRDIKFSQQFTLN